MNVKYLLLISYFSVFKLSSQVNVVVTGLSSPYGLALDSASNLYISETTANKISFVHLADQQPTISDLFTSGLNKPARLKIFNNYLYVTESESSEISRYNMLAAPPQMLPYISSGLTFPVGLEVINSEIWVGDYGSYAIRKINITTLPFQSSVVTQDLATDIVIDDDIYYYANPDYGLVNSNSIQNPSPQSTNILSSTSPSSLMIHNNFLYVADQTEGKIYRLNLLQSTNFPQTIMSGLDNPHGMIIYNNELYVAETGAGQIVKMNLNNLQNQSFENQNSLLLDSNPVKDWLYINAHILVDEITIYDLIGKKVRQAKPVGSSLDISELTSGIYLLKAVDKFGKEMNSKFLKL